MNIKEAISEVKSGTREGLRGKGCATICATNGRKYNLIDELGKAILIRFSDHGEVVERISPPESFTGDIEIVEWSCDESGAIYE